MFGVTAVRVLEFHGRLSRTSRYYYVLEGNRVAHISRYGRLVGRRDYQFEYEVDLDKVGDKEVAMVSRVGKHLDCEAFVFPAQELAKAGGFSSFRREGLSMFNGRDFEYLTPKERAFLEVDWRRYYLRKLDEIRGLEDSLGTPVRYASELLGCQVGSGADYPLPFLIPDSDRARRTSLKALGRQLHQAWLALKALSVLRGTGVEVVSSELVFEQNSLAPLFVIRAGGRVLSVWYEFDLYPHTMCRGLMLYPHTKYVWLPEDYSSYVEAQVSSPRGHSRDFWPLWERYRADPGIIDRLVQYSCPALYPTYLRVADYLVRQGRVAKGLDQPEMQRLARQRPVTVILSAEVRVPLRPDILVMEDVTGCQDICKKGVRARLIVELKDRDYEEWKGDVDSQIIPYREIFRPERMVVASVRPVPEGARARLRSKGIEVIEGVYPGGPGEGALLDAVKGAIAGREPS